MSFARPILPGQTYLVTRRCTQRMFLLRPRPLVKQAFLYVMAIAAARYKIQVHAVVILSNHWHVHLTDSEGKLPEFVHYVHEFTAKILNCEMGRFENLWSSEKTSMVALQDQEDILDKLVYVMANPVAAQLVEKGKLWPGLRHMWQDKDASLTVERPQVFYRPEGKMPESATLTFTRPPVLANLSDAEASKELRKCVLERERAEKKRILEAGGRFLGVDAILRQKLTATPKTYAAKFGRSPKIAAKSKWTRLEATRRLKDWLRAYREAYLAWKNGQRDVEFPYGTYALKRFAGVCCASP